MCRYCMRHAVHTHIHIPMLMLFVHQILHAMPETLNSKRHTDIVVRIAFLWFTWHIVAFQSRRVPFAGGRYRPRMRIDCNRTPEWKVQPKGTLYNQRKVPLHRSAISKHIKHNQNARSSAALIESPNLLAQTFGRTGTWGRWTSLRRYFVSIGQEEY